MHINCCIIGYRPFLRNVSANLASILDELIRNHGVDTFYVGESGALDPLFATAVGKAKKKYPHIRLILVKEHPGKSQKKALSKTLYDEIAFPGRENPLRWRVDRCEYVIRCGDWSRVHSAVRYAAQKGKQIFRL